MPSAMSDLPDLKSYSALHDLLSAEPALPFYVQRKATSRRLDWFADRLQQELISSGYRHCEKDNGRPRFVLNMTAPGEPVPYRRNSRAVFVAGLMEGPTPKDPLITCYPLLIRTLSNILIYLTPGTRTENFQAHCITPERGYYALSFMPGKEEAFFQNLVQRLMPIASSHLVIENEFEPDLPEELRHGDKHTAAFYEAGQRLDGLKLLPAPFDLNKLLPYADLRHLKRLYKMGGLSHGNMSQRLDAERFWMSASGVDKSSMREIGRDILLVKGFSPKRMSMVLSVPPHISPRRVSVDAIEHWMIYTEHPAVGAILHVHAWMDGVASTEVNYPCGTLELACAVADLVRRAEDPGCCVVGLKNHGLTITGRSLLEILDRVEGRLLTQIPMD